MTISRIEAIHNYRRQQRNPYACIEELEELSAIREARKVSEDPYAHIEDVEAYFDGPTKPAQDSAGGLSRSAKAGKSRYTEFEVERFARDLQRRMWKDRAKLFGSADAISPFDVLNPVAALKYLGFEVEQMDSLGQYRDSRGSFDVAGSISRTENVVRLASQLPPSFRNFTAAHELGHAVMHDMLEMHRDRPLDGSASSPAIEERQADKFAAYFLMPRKLVTVEFERIFGRAPFELDEDREFALFGSQQRRQMSLRELSRTLASTNRFNGLSFPSLAEIFNVSVAAMAIRLEELGLVMPSSI